MTDVFVDSQLTTGANDGTTFDDAYQTVKGGMEATRVAGDKVWIRRRSSHNAASNIQPPSKGYPSDFVVMQGCPRNEKTGTITFTNGSNVLSGCSFTPVFEQHCSRMIKCDADGNQYFVTAVVLKIAYDGETGAFIEGLMVTDGTSGATGKIHKIQDDGTTGYLWVVVQSGTFGDNNAITDTDVGAALVNGAPADDGFTILSKYAGTTATSTAFTIEEDEDYNEFQAIDDSTWTIKKTDWQSDPDTLFPLDFNGSSYHLYIYTKYYKYKNINLKNASGTYGALWVRALKRVLFINCIFETTFNTELINMYVADRGLRFNRCVLKGNFTGTNQNGFANIGTISLNDCAVYNLGHHGITGGCVLNNVNIGIELPNGDDDISSSQTKANTVRLGGLNGTVSLDDTPGTLLNFENYNGILGAHRTYGWYGYFIKEGVVTGDGDPHKRSNGNDSVLALYSRNQSVYQGEDYIAAEMFTYEIEAEIGSKTYRVYLQNSGCGDLNTSDAVETADVFLEAEYISGYGNSSDEYNSGIARSVSSANPIPNRGSVSDWDDYIEVTVNPAVASKIRITMKTSFYSVSGILYIDPLVVIS